MTKLEWKCPICGSEVKLEGKGFARCIANNHKLFLTYRGKVVALESVAGDRDRG